MWVGVTAHLCVFVSVCVFECVTHAGAQAAWQARPPFGWLASRQEHGRGRKWSLAAGSRKDWKSSSPAMNRHRDTKHGSQSSTTHRPWTQTASRQLASPRRAPTTSASLGLISVHGGACVTNNLTHRPVMLWTPISGVANIQNAIHASEHVAFWS